MPIITIFCIQTMKTLLILRHAKSSWDDPTIDDHNRPLNPRGLKTTPLMGRLVKEKNLVPDLILCSTALRALQTAQLIADSSGYKDEIRMIRDFYPGDTDSYIKALDSQDAELTSIMIIGHNPGLESFLEHLTGRKEIMPTAALAQVRLPIDAWSQLTAQTKSTLVHIYRPKEIFKKLL